MSTPMGAPAASPPSPPPATKRSSLLLARRRALRRGQRTAGKEEDSGEVAASAASNAAAAAPPVAAASAAVPRAHSRSAVTLGVRDGSRDGARDGGRNGGRNGGHNDVARPSRLLRQLEYYFGDYNLPRDRFMLETMEEHGGWIPLRVMMTFPRLRDISGGDPKAVVDVLTAAEDGGGGGSELVTRNPIYLSFFSAIFFL